MLEELILILSILFIGSFIQGASGFGFGLFSMVFCLFFLIPKHLSCNSFLQLLLDNNNKIILLSRRLDELLKDEQLSWEWI
ncbi:hypothetical protein AAAC51_38040 [Priestia megaterium]